MAGVLIATLVGGAGRGILIGVPAEAIGGGAGVVCRTPPAGIAEATIGGIEPFLGAER